MDSLSFNSAALLKFAGDLSFDKEFSDGYIEDDAALFYTMIGELSLSLRRVLKVEWSFWGVLSRSIIAALLMTEMAPLELLECRLLLGNDCSPWLPAVELNTAWILLSLGAGVAFTLANRR